MGFDYWCAFLVWGLVFASAYIAYANEKKVIRIRYRSMLLVSVVDLRGCDVLAEAMAQVMMPLALGFRDSLSSH